MSIELIGRLKALKLHGMAQCWPELWVRRPGDALRARGLIEQVLHPDVPGEPWTCPGCGERLEAQFAQCWRCATDAPPPGTGT